MFPSAPLRVAARAVGVAPLFTVRVPPVPVRARLAVARVAALLRVRVPAHRIPFVAIVKVAAAGGPKCTLLNSATPRLPKVMTRETAQLKTIVAGPAAQNPLAAPFPQEPLHCHVARPAAHSPMLP